MSAVHSNGGLSDRTDYKPYGSSIFPCHFVYLVPKKKIIIIITWWRLCMLVVLCIIPCKFGSQKFWFAGMIRYAV